MTPSPSAAPFRLPNGHRILLTGGAGFIGTAIAERLVDSNTVVMLDRSFDGQPVEFSPVRDHPNLVRIQGDVLDAELLGEEVRRCDSVVHMAAIVGVRRVLDDARGTLVTNFQGTANLLAAAASNPLLKRLVYFSTSEIFGMNSFGVDEHMPSSIGPVGEARWSYAISKLAGEHLLAAYHRECNIPTVIVRPFNVFGPGRTGDHAVLRFIGSALLGRDLVVHGHGGQIRSWCFIDDFVDGLLRALTMDVAVGESFNLGNSRNTLTIYGLAQEVIRVTGASSQVRFEHIDFADIDIRVPVVTKAERLLGYVPRIEMEEGIARTAAWYRDHLGVVRGVLG